MRINRTADTRFEDRRTRVVALIVAGVLAVATYVLMTSTTDAGHDVTVAISPYQDLAMLVNIEPLGLEARYDTAVAVRTIPWEETYTAILSAAGSIDLAFASLADYLTKSPNLNRNTTDPLLFLYPAYVFRGGAFVSFRDQPPVLTPETVDDPEALQTFLRQRIGLPRDTLYQMIVYDLAARAGIDPADLNIVDVGFDAGLLASQAGDLDAAAVGLTQLTEARSRGATVVLEMDTLRFADVTGFIARRSVLDAKQRHLENVIRMWFDCVDHVLADLDRNSAASLAYLRDAAATAYTLESYKAALAQEFFPRSVAELRHDLLSADGRYPVRDIETVMLDFLRAQGVGEVPAVTDTLVDLE